MKLHEKIIKYRKRCCLSQEGLAEKIGVSRQAVSKWETGDALPEITKLKALAEVFGVTVDFLLNEDEDTYTPPQHESVPPKYSYQPPKANGFDKFDAWLEALPEKIMPFLKKYGWTGGIILIVVGVYNTIASIVGCAIALFSSAGFNTVGMGFVGIPVLLSSLLSVAVGVAMIIGGVTIVKKFKPKSE
ncbi:MAG: helix-turn-helix transcriptional regulator [Clostridia bacterium]|nr:helix-turn-helix transcriptional regulator [Clostridia bacterium]